MRIAVMGAGGVGGYFGARLAHAGHDVAFIARGRHLAALRERGLAVKSANGDVRLAHPNVTEDPATLDPADVVLFAVKLWDTESAADAVRPLVARGGVIVPFQNGVESIDRIGAVVGAARVMGGVAYIAATIAEPGVIAHTGTMARLRFGPVLPGAACRRRGAARGLQRCRHRGRAVRGHPPRAVGEVRLPRRVLRDHERVAPTARRGARRSRFACRARVGDSRGMDARSHARASRLADDFVEEQMKFADALPAEMKSSMQNDLAAGNRLEAPWLCGAVARMAAAAGIPAPVNATLYAALKPYCAGAPR